MSDVPDRRGRRQWWAGRVRRRLGDDRTLKVSGPLGVVLEELEARQLSLLRARRRLAHHAYCRCCGRQISSRRLDAVRGAVLCTVCALLARRSRNLLDPLGRRN